MDIDLNVVVDRLAMEVGSLTKQVAIRDAALQAQEVRIAELEASVGTDPPKGGSLPKETAK